MSNAEALAMLQVVDAADKAGDHEAAHMAEDALHRRVIEAIMRGEGDAIALSAIAHTTSQYKFNRWTA
jgi:hypothetical protein